MLGWHINVYPKPETFELKEQEYSVHHGIPHTEVIASWSATLSGLDWLTALVEKGLAKELAVNGGYPIIYEARWADVKLVLASPPSARRPAQVMLDPNDAAPDLVIIDAWDQS